MQQTFPSRSQEMRASFSPVWIPARSRTSLGRTIWPRSSTESTASTRQPDGDMQAEQPGSVDLFLDTIIHSMSDNLIVSDCSDRSDYDDSRNLILWK